MFNRRKIRVSVLSGIKSEKAKLTKSSQWSSLFLYSLFVIWKNGNRQIIDLTMVDYFLILKRRGISSVILKMSDQCQNLINCKPTPPLTQH